MICGGNAWGSDPNPAGAAPLRPALKPKPSQEGKAKPHRPSRWSGIGHQQRREKKLALRGGHGLEQLQILSAAHLAGFEVITHGRICGVRRGAMMISRCRLSYRRRTVQPRVAQDFKSS